MSDQPASTTPVPAPAGDWLTRMARKRREVGYVLLAVGIACLIGAVAAGMRTVTPAAAGEEKATRGVDIKPDFFLLTLFSGSVGLVLTGGAAWQLVGVNRPGHERDSSRLLVMTLGALIGLSAVLFIGLGLAVVWREVILGGWLVWKGAQGWKLWVVIAGLFGGMALSFVSIQLARADERTSPRLRRLLYGFNAVFTSLLLATILLFLNLLAYAPWGPLAALGKEYSWAQRNLYDLGADSQRILEAIDKPTRVTVIMPTNDQFNFYYRTLALLENCKDTVNDSEKFDFEFLSPDRDKDRVDRLMDDYHFDGRAGVLIVYGSGATKDSAFIKYNDLGEADPRSRVMRFIGEQVFMTELNLLQNGKSKPTIYFTQGNGELDVSARPAAPNDKMDILKKTLELNRYKAKALQFVPVDKPPDGDTVFAREVPADAGVLVIARPTEPFPKFALDAIANYLDKRHGKAMIFFDVAVGPNQKMAVTGLEEMMKKYNVVVGDDRVMSYGGGSLSKRNPVEVAGIFPKGRGLSGDLSAVSRGFPAMETRTVYPAERPVGPYRTEMLAEVPGTVWAEKDVTTDPLRLLAHLTDTENKNEISKRMAATRKPVSIAVTVSEVPAAGPHAAAEGAAVPQMIVYGDSTWLSNRFWNDPGMAQMLGNLFAAQLSWLRQRPEILSLRTKNTDMYLLPSGVSFGRTVLLPGVLMMAGIIGLGAGVWVVRRR